MHMHINLHQKTYPGSLCGSENIGKTLLASHYVAGPMPEIKKSVTGIDQSGDIELLIVKAHFDKAKPANLKKC